MLKAMNTRKGLWLTFVLSVIAGILGGYYGIGYTGNTFPPTTFREDPSPILIFAGLSFGGVWIIYAAVWFVVRMFTDTGNPGRDRKGKQQ